MPTAWSLAVLWPQDGQKGQQLLQAQQPSRMNLSSLIYLCLSPAKTSLFVSSDFFSKDVPPTPFSSTNPSPQTEPSALHTFLLYPSYLNTGAEKVKRCKNYSFRWNWPSVITYIKSEFWFLRLFSALAFEHY